MLSEDLCTIHIRRAQATAAFAENSVGTPDGGGWMACGNTIDPILGHEPKQKQVKSSYTCVDVRYKAHLGGVN